MKMNYYERYLIDFERLLECLNFQICLNLNDVRIIINLSMIKTVSIH